MYLRMVTLFAILLMTPWGSHGQPLHTWLETAGHPNQEYVRQLNDFVESLRENNPTSTRQLSKVVRKVQASYLKNYEAQADFSSLLETGSYDCLTATALFSHVLSELKYDYRILETNYHIFLLVQSGEGEVLLETTDRVSGLLVDPGTIAKRIETYRNLVASAGIDKESYQYRCAIFREVTPDQLTGLLLFNQAVKAYNEGDWLTSAKRLEASAATHATERTDELGTILIQTLVIRKDISQDLRRACMEHLMTFVVRRASPTVARADTD